MSMGLLLPLLLLAAPARTSQGHWPTAAEVFHCTFDRSWDANYDGWPAGWTRRGRSRLPRVRSHEAPPRAAAQTARPACASNSTAAPPWRTARPSRSAPCWATSWKGRSRPRIFEYDRAYLSITLLDKNRRKLRTFRSSGLDATKGWTHLRLGPIDCDGDGDGGNGIQRRRRREVCHPRPARRAAGRARGPSGGGLFHRHLVRMPAAAGAWVEPAGGPGDHKRRRPKSFARRPASSNRAPKWPFGWKTAWDACWPPSAVRWRSAPKADPHDVLTRRRPPAPCWIGQARWEPPLAGPGFYRDSGEPGGRADDRRTRPVEPGGRHVLARPGPKRVRLDSAAGPADADPAAVGRAAFPSGHSLGEISPLVRHVGRARLRSAGPLPSATPSTPRGSRWSGCCWPMKSSLRPGWSGAIGTCQRLGRIPARFAPSGHGIPSAAEAFAPPVKAWYPSLEPTMIRLATQVRWWQLGTDGDTSFVGCRACRPRSPK